MRRFLLFAASLLVSSFGFAHAATCYDVLGRSYDCTQPGTGGGAVIAPGFTTPSAFAGLSQQVYAGGYLQYSSNNDLANQLKTGSEIPVRFGRLQRRAIGIDEISADLLSPTDKAELKQTQSATEEFVDEPGSQAYGIIKILEIDANHVLFLERIYSSTGQLIRNQQQSITLNQTIDVNGDGLNDLSYKENIGRAYEAGVRYLQFISSKEQLYTTMYSYNPPGNPTINQDCKLLGLNFYGRKILLAQTSQAATGLAKSQEINNYGIASNDIIVDLRAGQYRRIGYSSIRLAKTTATATIASVSQVSAEIKSVDEALPLLAVNSNTEYNDAGTDATTLFHTRAEYTSEIDHFRSMVKGHSISLPEIPFSGTIGDKVKFGVKSGKINLGINTNGSISWTSASLTTETMVMVEFKAGIFVEDNTVLGSYSVSETISKGFMYIDGSHRTAEYNVLNLRFVVGPLLVSTGVNLSSGIEGKVGLKATDEFGANICRIIKSESSVSISLFDGVNSQTKNNKRLLIYPENTSALQLYAEIMPYVSVDFYVKLWEVLYAGVKNQYSIGPVFVVGPVYNSGAESYILAKLSFKQKLEATFNVGLKAEIKILWKKISLEKTWPVAGWKWEQEMALFECKRPMPPANQIYVGSPIDPYESGSQVSFVSDNTASLDLDKPPKFTMSAILDLLLD